MTIPVQEGSFAEPVTVQSLEQTAAALVSHGFTVEILDDAAAARVRTLELVPEGASVLTAASETLRLSGLEEDLNDTERYDSVRRRGPGDGPSHSG